MLLPGQTKKAPRKAYSSFPWSKEQEKGCLTTKHFQQYSPYPINGKTLPPQSCFQLSNAGSWFFTPTSGSLSHPSHWLGKAEHKADPPSSIWQKQTVLRVPAQGHISGIHQQKKQLAKVEQVKAASHQYVSPCSQCQQVWWCFQLCLVLMRLSKVLQAGTSMHSLSCHPQCQLGPIGRWASISPWHYLGGGSRRWEWVAPCISPTPHLMSMEPSPSYSSHSNKEIRVSCLLTLNLSFWAVPSKQWDGTAQREELNFQATLLQQGSMNQWVEHTCPSSSYATL